MQTAEKAFDLEDVGSNRRCGLGSLHWSRLVISGRGWRVQGIRSPLQTAVERSEAAAEMSVRNENSSQRKEYGLGMEDGQHRRGEDACDSLVHCGPVDAQEVVVGRLYYTVAGIPAAVAVALSLGSGAVAAVAAKSVEAAREHRRAPSPQRDNFRDHLHGLALGHCADEDRQRARARKLAPEKKRG